MTNVCKINERKTNTHPATQYIWPSLLHLLSSSKSKHQTNFVSVFVFDLGGSK